MVTGPLRGNLTAALGALLLFGAVFGAPKSVSADTTPALGHGIHQSWGYGYPYYGPTAAGWNGYRPYGGYRYQYPGYSDSTSSSASPTVPATSTSASSTSDSTASATAVIVCEAFIAAGIFTDCDDRVDR